WRYHDALETGQKLYDKTLFAIALAISRRVTASGGDLVAEDMLEVVTEYLGDQVFYKVSTTDGSVVTGYASGPAVPKDLKIAPGRPSFFDGSFQGDVVRAAIYRELVSDDETQGWVTIKIWQTTRERTAFAQRVALQSLAMMLAIIGAAGFVIWFGVNRGLRPLVDLVDAVELRSPDDLSSIRRRVPQEVTSLVKSMNNLFGQLREAFAARDVLIANAAHQLRNPIAAILSQAEVAAAASDPEEIRRRAKDVVKAARQTSRLTQQLLSMEKARGRGEKSVFDLSKLTEDVARQHAPAAMRKGGNFSFSEAPSAMPIKGDETMVREAIDNLIDNAVKYGLRDGGAIKVSVAQSGHGKAIVQVEDDGPGIAPTQSDKIFDRFYRLDDSQADGCGLGLAIVSEVAIAHGGDVTHSNGTTTQFSLTLPLHEDPTSAAEQVQAQDMTIP
ncbi:MAG: sensor histidine kinase, partial [Pseudomonadota bacterium]